MKKVPQDDFEESTFFEPAAPVQSSNPLAQYFRVPGLHVTLPTRGAFLPPHLYEETLAGDVPIYPMKAADELLLRSPDALMSGYALEKLVASCVPAIRAPRLISTPDLDVILLAIRAATYGENMEIEVPCPECGHLNSFDCHLPSIMSKMTYVDPVNEVRLSEDVMVNVRPYTLETASKAALATFNETRRYQAAEEGEERRLAMNESYERMSKINIDSTVDSIISIAVPGSLVTDRTNISDFVNNTSQAWVKKIEEKLNEINKLGIDKRVDATCVKCSHEWEPEVEFDPTSFFGSSS